MGRICNFIGISVLISLFLSCRTSSHLEAGSLDTSILKTEDSLDCYSFTRIVGPDTSKINHCVPRNASIFVEGKRYTYTAIVTDSNNNLLSKSKVLLIGKNERHPDSPLNQMKIEMLFDRFPGDSSKLNSISGNKTCCRWLESWETGITENIERVWIHPIRVNQFTLTETAGFPEVHFPLSEGNSWNRSVTMGDWGDWMNKSVVTNYKVVSKTVFDLRDEKLDCWEIKAVSQFDGRVNTVNYLFNERFGFVLMKYEFYNGIRINFEMVDYTFK